MTNTEFVVTLNLADGSTVRGIQSAWYGHSAIKFYAKAKGIQYVSATAERKDLFDRFLSQGFRQPLA